MPKWVLLVGLTVVLLSGGAWFLSHQQGTVPQYRTAPVARKDLTATISATGTLEPEVSVDVGAQVNGQIIAFGPDLKNPGKTVDYGSQVEAGQLLAKIDDRLYQDDLLTAKAAVASANASIDKFDADLSQMRAKLFQATNDWNRIERLGPSSGVSQSEHDQYEANYLVAKANVDDAAAALAQARTVLEQDRVALIRAQQNVDYCTITSPVRGTIIDRRMNAGQTVNSAMSAPSLFLIAEDLRRMQVWAAVNEADVGNIHHGQAVTFTVDAYPGQTFHGIVNKRRDNANMSQNVVTYTVEIDVDNSNGRLLPYLTANVTFQLDQRPHAQVVPNAALRWMPQDSEVEPGSNDGAGTVDPLPTTVPIDDVAAAEGMRDRGTVWLEVGNGMVRPVRVRVGVTDGVVSEVAPEHANGLTDGAQVVTSEIDPAEIAATGTASPFLPQFGKHKH
jgi:HlyD family secretion protein